MAFITSVPNFIEYLQRGSKVISGGQTDIQTDLMGLRSFLEDSQHYYIFNLTVGTHTKNHLSGHFLIVMFITGTQKYHSGAMLPK
jgi:hypothetical protein